MVEKTKRISKKKGFGLKYNAKRLGQAVTKAGTNSIMDRYIKGKHLNLANAVSDIKWLMNVEKKRHVLTSSAVEYVGQSNGNSSGHLPIYITPQPSQGDGYNQRNGNSFKLLSQYMQFQFKQESSATAGIKLIIDIWQTTGMSIGSPTVFGEVINLYKPNQWVSDLNVPTGTYLIYDTSSAKNPDYQGNCKKIRTIKVTLPADTLSTQVTSKTIPIKMKYKNHHIKFDGNTSTMTTGELWMVIRADRGNNNGSASTLQGVIDQVADSGLEVLYSITSYYVDN